MISLRNTARLAAVSAAALALSTGLAACGSDSKDADTKEAAPKAEVLSETEAEAALLVQANLGEGFTLDEDDSDEDDDAPGCMAGVGEVLGDDDEAETSVDRTFTYEDDTSAVLVSNKVLSYASVAEAEDAIKNVRKTLEECDAVNETEDGFSYDLEVTSDDDKSEDNADDQVNAVADGTLTAEGTTGPSEVALHLALVRVGNNITAVTATAIAVELPGPLTEVLEVSNDRLTAVVAGKTPDDSVVAGE